MQDLRMPGTAKHSCLGSETIFSIGAFKEKMLASCEEVTVKCAEELLSGKQNHVSHR